jgi:hypothetical protein
VNPRSDRWSASPSDWANRFGNWFWQQNTLRRTELEIMLRVVAVFVAMAAHDTFTNDVGLFWLRAHDLGLHHLPYKDFLWEYPPLAALPLLLVFLSGGTWMGFRLLFVVTMIALEYGSLVLLRRARPQSERDMTSLWTMSVVPLGLIAYFRLDFITMFCATIAMVAMVQNRRYVGATVAGFAAKLWPILFVAPMVLQRKWRDAVLAVAGSAAVVLAWWLYTPDGFHQFLQFRQGDGFQVESIPGSIAMLFGAQPHISFGAVNVPDAGWEWVQVVMTALLLGLPAVMFVAAWRDRERVDLVALLGTFVAIALLCQRLLSPQFLVWLAPFVVWLWPRHQAPGKLFAIAGWLTLVIIQFYDWYLGHDLAIEGICVARNAVLVVMGIQLARIAFGRCAARDEQLVER